MPQLKQFWRSVGVYFRPLSVQNMLSQHAKLWLIQGDLFVPADKFGLSALKAAHLQDSNGSFWSTGTQYQTFER